MSRSSSVVIMLSDADRCELERRAGCYMAPHAEVIRATIVLRAADGLANAVIAGRLDISVGASRASWPPVSTAGEDDMATAPSRRVGQIRAAQAIINGLCKGRDPPPLGRPDRRLGRLRLARSMDVAGMQVIRYRAFDAFPVVKRLDLTIRHRIWSARREGAVVVTC